MPTLNYSTSVPVTRTLAEIHALLSKHRADAVATRYSDGQPVGVSFTVDTPNGRQAYNLPVDVDAMQQLLSQQRRDNSRVNAKPEQAQRVAWRVVKDWLAAQLALIDARMATLDEVMLPYMVVGHEITLREQWRQRGALEGPQDT